VKLLLAGWILASISVGLAVAAMQRPSYDDLTQRLAYTVLYDRMFFDAAVKDADRGVPVGTWVQKRIAEEHDQWLRGELRPVLREYFRRMPWRCISFPDDYRELFCGKKT